MINRISILLAVAFLLTITACFTPEPPKVEYQNTTFKFLSFQQGTARFNFSITNPHPMNVRTELEYGIKLNNRDLLNGSLPVEVKAHDTTSFAIVSNVNLPKTFGMLQEMLQEIQNGKDSIPFAISGTCRATVLGVPIQAPVSAKGELPLPKIPEFDISKVSIGSISAQGATLVLKTNIRNTNNFPLDLGSFDYILRQEGKEIADGSFSQPVALSAGGNQAVDLKVNVNFAEFDQKWIDEIKNGTFQPEILKEIKSIK